MYTDNPVTGALFPIYIWEASIYKDGRKVEVAKPVHL
ncbi:hypothetical protein BMS3Bbin15_01702 [archaeon BMS3Bbin15]|nr:hypothetical protein BMS3Bbin15_01702 [archaeon BMS3Bbin15]